MPKSIKELPSHTSLTVDIVATFVAHNSLAATELPSLIQSVYGALVKLGSGSASAIPSEESTLPAVSAAKARKSITPDYIVCLEDGRKFKSMKRHLALLGMTPKQYRAKWNLPDDYPIVAPNYAAKRSKLAKAVGLGHLRERNGTRKQGQSPKAMVEPSAL